MTRSCDLYTGRLGLYQGDDGLDISLTGNHPVGKLFAPSIGLFLTSRAQRRRLVTTYVRNQEWLGYIRRYGQEMAATYARQPGAFLSLLKRRELTLLCHCHGPTYCHRSLLANALVTMGARYQGER